MQAPRTSVEANVHRALNARAAEPVVRAFCFALPTIASDGTPPDWIPFLPAPDASGRITGEDGRSWRLPDAKAVAAKFKRKLPVDVNHSTEIAAKNGGESPAFGFIHGFRVEADGSTSANVQWNERGINALRAKDYAFISPVFDHAKDTGEILAYASAALCNDPNFPSLALNARRPTEDAPMLERLLALLGLTANASEEEATRAINTIKSDRDRAINARETPDLTRFVPRADHDAVTQRATNAEAALKKVQDDQTNAEIGREIDGALKAGKITPATKDYHRASCAREGGLQAFRDYVKSAPVIAADQIVTTDDPSKAANGVTESQRAICRRLGLDPKAYSEAAVAYAESEKARRGDERQAA